jgi:hypothetical protein
MCHKNLPALAECRRRSVFRSRCRPESLRELIGVMGIWTARVSRRASAPYVVTYEDAISLSLYICGPLNNGASLLSKCLRLQAGFKQVQCTLLMRSDYDSTKA